jgi:hypothetical protein
MSNRSEIDRLIQGFEDDLSPECHKMSITAIYEQLNSSPDGLNSQQSKIIRGKVGLNNVPPPLSAPAWLCCLLPCLLRTKAMQEYNECVPEHAMVKRNGTLLNMDTTSLVPGDIVIINEGQRVPADIRIIEV